MPLCNLSLCLRTKSYQCIQKRPQHPAMRDPRLNSNEHVFSSRKYNQKKTHGNIIIFDKLALCKHSEI